MSIGNKSLVSFLILLVVAVSFITWLSYRNNRRYHDALVSVNRSNDILYSTEQLISTLKDVQLFSHNYVFTKDEAYIHELDAAISMASTRLRTLRKLVSDNPIQTRLVDSLSFYMEQRIYFSRKITETRLDGDAMRAFEMVASGQGIDLMKKLVLIVRQMRQAERNVLLQRQERSDMESKQFDIFFDLTIGVILAMTALTVAITVYNSRLESKIKTQMKEVAALNEDLQKRERRFRGLVENGFDVISLSNEAINPIYQSPAAERLTGWSNEERTQVVGVENAHPDDVEQFKETIRQVLENPGKPFEVSVRTLHKDGHYIWLEGVMKNMLHDDSLRGIVSNFRDVSERKKTETQRALYESIIQYSDDAIISKSVTGLIITWNRGAESLFGYNAEEVIGKSFAVFTPNDLVEEELEIISKVQAGIAVENFETERVTKTGKRTNVSLTASPLIDPQGKMIGTSQIARDITERKIAQEKIHRLNMELEQKVILRTKELMQVNRELEAVSYYISRVVHAPLQEIQNATTLLQEQLRHVRPETNPLVGAIGLSVNEALRLIDELIEFSEISQHKLRLTYIDMNDLVEQAQKDLPPEIRDQHAISFNQLHPLIGDAHLLKKLLIHLVAIRHTTNRGLDRSPIQITSEVNPENVCYSIHDRHTTVYHAILEPWLTPDEIEGNQSFDPIFVSVLIIRHIILKHNGNMRTEAVGDTGSSVTFSIPINKLNID